MAWETLRTWYPERCVPGAKERFGDKSKGDRYKGEFSKRLWSCNTLPPFSAHFPVSRFTYNNGGAGGRNKSQTHKLLNQIQFAENLCAEKEQVSIRFHPYRFSFLLLRETTAHIETVPCVGCVRCVLPAYGTPSRVRAGLAALLC